MVAPDPARVWFKPVPPHRLIDPVTRREIPPAGKWVPRDDPYWMRLGPKPVGDGGGEFFDVPPAGAEAAATKWEADRARPPEAAAAAPAPEEKTPAAAPGAPAAEHE
jgi:hypothetical protein